jgi:hypothetical protein
VNGRIGCGAGFVGAAAKNRNPDSRRRLALQIHFAAERVHFPKRAEGGGTRGQNANRTRGRCGIGRRRRRWHLGCAIRATVPRRRAVVGRKQLAGRLRKLKLAP